MARAAYLKTVEKLPRPRAGATTRGVRASRPSRGASPLAVVPGGRAPSSGGGSTPVTVRRASARVALAARVGPLLAALVAVGCADAPAPVGPYTPAPWGPPPQGGAWIGPPPPSPAAAAAVAFARSRLGAPYCWGGTGPGCYDCSGLTQAAWWAAGKAIPRTSAAQGGLLPEVPLDRVEPGDILWRPGHVALYVGDGMTITAPQEGGVVKLARATRYVKAVRP